MKTKDEVKESLAIGDDYDLKEKVVSYGTFENMFGKGFIFIVRMVVVSEEVKEYLKRTTGCKYAVVNKIHSTQSKITLSDKRIPKLSE